MNTKHTATPWKEGVRGPNNMPVIGANGIMLAHVCTGVGFQDEADANAAFIVRAVNSHDDMVEAIKRLLGCMSLAGWENDNTAIFAREVLKKAGAK